MDQALTRPLPGKKVVDISELLDIFEAQEGIIEHIIGKTGNGKTYYANKRAWELLLQGNVVYTTWKMILPDIYDQRSDFETVFWKTLLFKKQFYSYNLKENWHWIDIERPDLKEYIASLTDCYVFLDEGQDIFSSHDRIDGQARRTITRTRHLRKTLIIVSQRAAAVDTNARANVSHYYKCVKYVAWFWPFRPYFKVFVTEEMDDQNLPVWEEHIPYSNGKVWRASIHTQYFLSKKIASMYNSWYLRDGIERSQQVNFEAYDLNTLEKIATMLMLVGKKKKKGLDKPSLAARQPSEWAQKLSTARNLDRSNVLESLYAEKEEVITVRDTERRTLTRIPVHFETRPIEEKEQEAKEVDYAEAKISRRKRPLPKSILNAPEHGLIPEALAKQAKRMGGVRPKALKKTVTKASEIV